MLIGRPWFDDWHTDPRHVYVASARLVSVAGTGPVGVADTGRVGNK